MDFRDIVNRQKQEAKFEKWQGVVLDYLKLVKQNPKITCLAPERIYNMIISGSTSEVDDSLKFSLLVHLLKNEKKGLVMVFCNSRRNDYCFGRIVCEK